MESADLRKLTQEEIEALLVTNFIKNEAAIETLDLPEPVRKILTGEYVDVVNNALPSAFIESLSSDDFSKVINNNVEADTDGHKAWLYAAVASVLYFVQCNWTGPQTDDDIEWLKNKRKDALQQLSLHDECNTNVKKPEFLYFSKVIFSNEALQASHKSCAWWLFRSNCLHQSILNENSGIIFEETENLIKRISALEILEDPYCKILFNVEAANFYFYYRRAQSSEQYVQCAQETGKLTLNLEGALGKRTKFQQHEKAQLYLDIIMGKEPFPSRNCEKLPKSLDLNDEVRLESVQFSEEKNHVQIGALEEAIILAKLVQLQLSQPKDKLTDEEIQPYLAVVIKSTKNWVLKVVSLSRRCALESNDKRTIERSMMQMEYLINELKNKKVSVQNRMDMFFASGMKSIWMLEQSWANLMLSLGLVKGALDVFLRLELWEDVITCYNLLELKHKAAEIIEQELAKKQTVQLWCLLGDATQNPEHYETAWKLSNEKSSRAQRHWGFYYFAKHNYQEAVPHLKLSVELNNIQENVWIRLGFAALQIEDWKLAAAAYRRYCALEPSAFEAWNNLAKAYIKLGDKPRAWKSLHDAIKCNYDQWQVWDNLMVVSIDMGHFAEVIRCYHRILDLKDHHLDVQVLEILTEAILNDIKDADGNHSRRLLPKALELFGRISASIPNSPDTWRMYAQLTALKKTDIDDQKVAQYLQQAHRAAVSNPKWFKEEKSTQQVLNVCAILAEAYLNCASDVEEEKKKRSLLGSAKLSLQGVVKKVKDQQWNNEQLLETLEKVEELLKTIVDNLDEVKLTS